MTAKTTIYPAAQIAAALGQFDLLVSAGRSAEAQKACRDMLADYPASHTLLNYLALLLKAGGEMQEAETLMRRAVAAAPREPALHNNLGNLLQQRGALEEAETAYRRATTLKPDYAQAYHNLGCVLQAADQDEQALAAFRRAAALKPGYTEALVQIGVQLCKKGRQEEALPVLHSAIVSNPRHFGARYYSGHALTALGHWEDAIKELEQAARLQPSSYEAAFALGNALSGAGLNTQALEAYRIATELAPEFVLAHYAFNQLAWMMGRSDLNLTSYATARAQVGDKPDLLLAEANQRIRHGEGEAAEQLLRRAREIAPERGDIGDALARALGQQKRHTEAAALMADVVAAEPGSLLHRRELGIALLQAGQMPLARQILREALAIDPFDQLSLAYLSLACRELGDSEFGRLVDVQKYVRAYEIAPPPGFGHVASFNRALREQLLGLHTRHVEPFDQTLRGGTQTTGSLFERRSGAVDGLYAGIREAVADYIASLAGDPAHPLTARGAGDFDFSGAWSCKLRSGGFHTNHVHHEGWISSAYYVSLPDVVEDEVTRQGWLKFGESRLGLGERDRPERLVKPSVGTLVLFPSYYWHGTTAFAADEDRLVVAFDVVPAGPRKDE